MTDEEQRIAIAKAVGWVALRACWVTVDRLSVVGYGPDNPFPHDKGEQEPPDFLNDLNAMYEAVNTLRWDNRLTWLVKLDEVTKRDTLQIGPLVGFPLRIANSTARQRSEAFLKTLGLWK